MSSVFMINLIMHYENPYPKDVYRWDTPHRTAMTQGRLNKLLYQTVENTREEIMKLIREEESGKTY